MTLRRCHDVMTSKYSKGDNKVIMLSNCKVMALGCTLTLILLSFVLLENILLKTILDVKLICMKSDKVSYTMHIL